MGALGQERVGSAGQAISMAQDLRTLLQTAKAENPDALRDPAIRERVAELHMQIDFTRLLIARALSKVLKGEKGWPEVPLAKLQWGYISLWLAELALDVLGPTGALLKGAPGAVDGGMWARNYVWQRYTTIGAGPTEVQKNIIADRALKLERLTQPLKFSKRTHHLMGSLWKRAGEKGSRSKSGSVPAMRSAISFPEIGPSSRPLAPWPVATNTLSIPGSGPSSGESSRLVGRRPTRTSPSVAVARPGITRSASRMISLTPPAVTSCGEARVFDRRADRDAVIGPRHHVVAVHLLHDRPRAGVVLGDAEVRDLAAQRTDG